MRGNSAGKGDSIRAAALQDELEELLNQVLDCEGEWRLMDRIDFDMRTSAQRGHLERDGKA